MLQDCLPKDRLQRTNRGLCEQKAGKTTGIYLMYWTEQSKEMGHSFLNNLLVEGFPSQAQSWQQYRGLANLERQHLEREYMEVFSLLHWEKIAVEQRKQIAASTTETEAGQIASFEGWAFNL